MKTFPLVVLLFAVAWAEEGPPPADAIKLEGTARLAKAEYDAAVKRAKAVYDQAVAATNRVYQEKLRVAMKEAMAAGKLEQANAINAELQTLASNTPAEPAKKAADISTALLNSPFVGTWSVGTWPATSIISVEEGKLKLTCVPGSEGRLKNESDDSFVEGNKAVFHWTDKIDIVVFELRANGEMWVACYFAATRGEFPHRAPTGRPAWSWVRAQRIK